MPIIYQIGKYAINWNSIDCIYEVTCEKELLRIFTVYVEAHDYVERLLATSSL